MADVFTKIFVSFLHADQVLPDRIVAHYANRWQCTVTASPREKPRAPQWIRKGLLLHYISKGGCSGLVSIVFKSTAVICVFAQSLGRFQIFFWTHPEWNMCPCSLDSDWDRSSNNFVFPHREPPLSEWWSISWEKKRSEKESRWIPPRKQIESNLTVQFIHSCLFQQTCHVFRTIWGNISLEMWKEVTSTIALNRWGKSAFSLISALELYSGFLVSFAFFCFTASRNGRSCELGFHQKKLIRHHGHVDNSAELSSS